MFDKLDSRYENILYNFGLQPAGANLQGVKGLFMPVIPRVLDIITCKISDLPLDLICSTYIYT